MLQKKLLPHLMSVVTFHFLQIGIHRHFFTVIDSEKRKGLKAGFNFAIEENLEKDTVVWLA